MAKHEGYRPAWWPEGQSVLDMALELHAGVTSPQVVGSGGVVHLCFLAGCLYYVVENWRPSENKFDKRVKQVIKAALREYDADKLRQKRVPRETLQRIAERAKPSAATLAEDNEF